MARVKDNMKEFCKCIKNKTKFNNSTSLPLDKNRTFFNDAGMPEYRQKYSINIYVQFWGKAR